jgi:type IV pilus assembly protein PilN
MIKINLVAEGRKPVVARRAKEVLKTSTTSLAEWAFFGALILALLGGGGYWWALKSQIDERDAAIVVAQREVEELKPIIKEVEEYKKKQAALEHKIQVINDLKNNQQGPVRIMDQVSRAVPELLWLDQMSLRGLTVELRGRAFNTSQVATFLENLNKVPEFQEPNLRETSKGAGASVYGFTITFNFAVEKPAATTDSQSAAGA